MSGFVKVGNAKDIKEGEMKTFDVDGEQVVVVKVKGKLHSFNGECPHKGGPLGEGSLNDNVITCPWHQVQFDVTTGKIVSIQFDPKKHGSVSDIKTYEVKVEGDDLLVNV